MRINPLFAQSDKKLSREVAPSEFFRLALAGAAPTSNPFQPDLGAVKLVKNAFVQASIRAPMLVALAAHRSRTLTHASAHAAPKLQLSSIS
jgi:hypothetical protein